MASNRNRRSESPLEYLSRLRGVLRVYSHIVTDHDSNAVEAASTHRQIDQPRNATQEQKTVCTAWHISNSRLMGQIPHILQIQAPSK